mmetsp:Transcript_8687/g.32058  ORF Transcript_8687/g.32058 Transcript_8687/m.32058 type:complete len:232 (+) Transcript_8687:588-1283(+)
MFLGGEVMEHSDRNYIIKLLIPEWQMLCISKLGIQALLLANLHESCGNVTPLHFDAWVDLHIAPIATSDITNIRGIGKILQKLNGVIPWSVPRMIPVLCNGIVDILHIVLLELLRCHFCDALLMHLLFYVANVFVVSTSTWCKSGGVLFRVSLSIVTFVSQYNGVVSGSIHTLAISLIFSACLYPSLPGPPVFQIQNERGILFLQQRFVSSIELGDKFTHNFTLESEHDCS